MLPLRSILVCALLLLARAATANWIESGDDVEIIVVRNGFNEDVEAEDVGPQEDIVQVSVSGGGEVTVVGEGSGNDRRVLGDWYIYEGEGNIQSVIGIIDQMRVGEIPGDTIGVLNILNSDLELGNLRVLNGTANLIASIVQDVEIDDGSSLYASMGSRLRGIWTHANSFTSIEGSIVSTPLACQLNSTVSMEDSALHCREITIYDAFEDTTNVDFYALAGLSVSLETTQGFVVWSGTVDIEKAIATTGEVEVGAAGDVDLDIVASHWTNAGGTQIEAGGTVSPVEMTIGGGTRFHELEDVRVTGHPAWQHLRVSGATTELEVEGDLRIGEYLDFRDRVQEFTGNMTVSNGATVIVHGALVVKAQGVLTIESGATVYAASVEELGAIDENGGTLVVPEAGSTFAGAAAIAALAWRSRRARST